ncbi:GIY-YIG nuclease family protein [Phormidium tenue FACHB-886]|nr:GIY-YIG nuclease family protein [Phormidium tenue FACHB-886]
MPSEQLSLFTSAQAPRGRSPQAELQISAEVLQNWKARIVHYQRQVELTPVPTQGVLFDLAAPAPLLDVHSLDPFTLPQHNSEFWRWKSADVGTAALYFVIDYEHRLLLYVGETGRSGQRWQGEHDCKRYLLNYQQVHYRCGLSSQLGIAFCLAAPPQRQARQQLEAVLIDKWRSPFNKENWDLWGTPFSR